MPERPPDTTGLPALDLLDAVPGLRLADRDWRALAAMRHPVKVALWLALLRPSEELFSRESLVELVRSNPERQGGESVNENPTGVPNDPADPALGTQVETSRFDSENTPHEQFRVAERSSIPAVIAWAEAAVRKGI